MNVASLSASYLRARPLQTALSLLLLSLSVAIIVLLLLVVTQLEERMMGDARGIDLVVGAKGSPMQLILAGVYHVDAPTGNIPLAAAMLPRYINSQTELQAASPAYETARLFSIVGVGVEALRAFAAVLMIAAGLSVFIALYTALEERRYDLAARRTGPGAR